MLAVMALVETILDLFVPGLLLVYNTYHAKPDTGGVMDRNYFKKDYISSCSAARIKI
jgi:hypothetical protein